MLMVTELRKVMQGLERAAHGGGHFEENGGNAGRNWWAWNMEVELVDGLGSGQALWTMLLDVEVEKGMV